MRREHVCSRRISTASIRNGATNCRRTGRRWRKRRGAHSTSGSDMSVEEAYAILGLSSGANAEAIKEAHRRLMVKLHPNHGGSDYLATKINRARDVLLHRR